MIKSDKKMRKRVICKLGNTTNLWQHMEESHIEEYRQAKEEAKQVNESESQIVMRDALQKPHPKVSQR